MVGSGVTVLAVGRQKAVTDCAVDLTSKRLHTLTPLFWGREMGAWNEDSVVSGGFYRAAAWPNGQFYFRGICGMLVQLTKG